MAAYGSPDEVLRPEIIEKYYGAKVYVGRHPAADLPQVVPDPGWMASRRD
jgi:ABC-type hemin transport system ATPase subunit